MSRSKRQTTMAKMTRERLVKEKREKKREKKEARAAEKARIAAGLPPEGAEGELGEGELAEGLPPEGEEVVQPDQDPESEPAG